MVLEKPKKNGKKPVEIKKDYLGLKAAQEKGLDRNFYFFFLHMHNKQKYFKVKTMKLSQLRQLIREEIRGVLNEEADADYTADYIAGNNFSEYIVPNSPKYTYGPDNEGTYHIEFQLALDILDYDTPEKKEKELQKAIGGSTYGGPGAGFSKTTVSYEGQRNGEYIFNVFQRGGYDV